MRAKFYITKIEQYESQDTIHMSAVTNSNKTYGPNGENEDNTFARFTPNGSLTLAVTNPDLIGKHKVGQKFYLDFREAAE